ncbi:DUF2304 domain-containing protein [Beggiatoa alba]|uniref:DUF2304 domain-containing protein n=1 Tax=Beggiatoa alba TaxID=1022 RepID=UPI0018DEE136|nr:DUF2304 domain-containing protein [Beggiatoa alba]
MTSAILGFGLATTILWLIRRDRLHGRHAFWWLCTAFFVVLLGVFPKIIDYFALKLGINYPPTLLFVLGMSMILIKVLSIDLHQSQLERKMRRLAQRLALLEAEHHQNRKQPIDELSDDK